MNGPHEVDWAGREIEDEVFEVEIDGAIVEMTPETWFEWASQLPDEEEG